MGKIKVTSKNNILEIVVKSVKGESLNLAMADWLSKNMVPDFIPPRIEQKGDKFTVTYQASGLVTLKTYMKNPLNQEAMYLLLSSIVKKFSKLSDYRMMYGNVLIDQEAVLVNPATKKAMFLYYPVEGYNNNTFVNNFLEQIIKMNKLPKGQNANYLSELQGILKHPETISWTILENCINKMNVAQPAMPQGQPIQMNVASAAYNQNNMGMAQPVAGFQVNVNPNAGMKNCTSCGKENLPDAKFCVKCGASFSDNISQTLSYMNNYAANTANVFNSGYADEENGTTLLMPEEDNEMATTVLNQVEEPVRKYPYLIRNATQEKTIISKDIFHVGKSQVNDYVISGNTNVSRNHADIIYQNGMYYIIDKNSTNHTYVNGALIQSNVPTQLDNDTTITLANEMLTYYME